MTETCKICAECCKNHPYVELSSDEINALEKLTGLPLDEFTSSKGKDVEEYFLQLKENGYCLFLKEDKNSFYCSVYEARPELCRIYPAKPAEIDVCNKYLKKSGG